MPRPHAQLCSSLANLEKVYAAGTGQCKGSLLASNTR